jgi:hypothetical protein
MSVSFLQAATDNSDLTTYTFSAQNLGAAASDRHIIVAIATRKAGATFSVSSVTIGGVAATIVKQQAHTVTNTSISAIAIANVPTGATGDVVITFSTGVLRCGIGLWRADNLLTATPYDSDSSIASDPTVNLDTPIGFAIGVGAPSGAVNAAWTGLTERYDATFDTTFGHTGASDEFSANQAARTITIDFASGSESAGCFASWRYKPASSATGFMALI